MPSPFTQDNRFIGIETPLGKDKLGLISFSGQESFGRLFEFQVEAASEDDNIPFDQIIGQPVSLRLNTTCAGPRFFHGHVSAFQQTGSTGGYSRYSLSIVPWLWLLTRTSDCRIYQEKTIKDIVGDVFQRHGFSDFEWRTTTGFTPWEYCVQYRETDFNFVSRLLEQEGVYYFFKHSAEKHTLILCDGPSCHATFPGYADITYNPSAQGSKNGEFILGWNIRREVKTGKFEHTDYDFKKAKTDLTKDQNFPRDHAFGALPIFDYPGEYVKPDDGKDWAKVRIQELQARFETGDGFADSRGIAVGHTFNLKEHPRQDQCRNWLVQSSNYSANAGEFRTQTTTSAEGPVFRCAFSVVDASRNFRPARATPKPMVQGPQTAVVVGPPGKEIWVDTFGRIKVHFRWDRHNPFDDTASCWIRVVQSWAGRKWGAVFIPRIGQEVMVEFLEGDPDQPIVTGSVYNNDQELPYGLPAERTKSTIKSNTSPGGVGFNEIRFEDKKDNEQVFVHAQNNMDVRVVKDEMESVGRDRHLTVGGEKDGAKLGDQNELVYRDKNQKVHRNLMEHIGGDMQLLVGGIDGPGNQDIVIKATKKELIEKDDHLHVKGKRNEKVDGDQSLTVGGNQQEKVDNKHAVDAGQEIHLKAGMKVVIEAGMQLTLKGPGGFVDISPSGVTIQGTMVLINSGGSAGSGSGSSPTAPEDAKEAKPVEPKPADDAQTGQKSCD